MGFTSINIQGNIVSLEILDKIRSVDNYPHQQAADFGFEKKVSLRDQITSAWTTAKGHWEIFKNKLEKLPENDTGFTITRKFWITTFLYELGYDIDSAPAEIVNGKSYAINHRDKNRDNFPVIVMGYNEKLDRKPESGRLRMSPHALMQEYLNYTEHLYGLITNGRLLRLLRDSNRLSKLAYIEFDLEKIMEADLYNEFALLYRLLHASRMPASQDEAESSIIEFYHQEAVDSGSRIRDKLRKAVKEAMEILTGGFLYHSGNIHFTEKVRRNEADPGIMYKLLLRCMYRIIFLATIEERELVYPYIHYKDPHYDQQTRLKQIYLKYYSIERLRNLVLSPAYINPGKHDLWQGLLATFRLFESGTEGNKLEIQPLDGELFGAGSMAEGNIDLYSFQLTNDCFIEVFRKLSTFRDDRGVLTRINYRDLDVEELGSVYEALLELHPYFNTEGPIPHFGFTESSERKLTGSYYTRHDLVAQLIKTALYPVMEDRLNKVAGKDEKEKALLGITVCDPAAGSGHFLIASAKVMGFMLAQIRSDEENPGEAWILPAIRDVIQYCIYGVDKNPAAVELCRLSLWLVGHNSGKPLTFLEHKIKCGDSLIGVDDISRLTKGIPSGAFKPTTGDDRTITGRYRALNEKFIKTRQLSLYSQAEKIDEDKHTFAEGYDKLMKIQVNTIADYSRKKEQYAQLEQNPRLRKNITACNLYTYAFFQSYTEGKEDDLVTSETLALFLNSEDSVSKRITDSVNKKSEEYRFFHWSLEFPAVFEKGGFDVVIGNPPWERIKLQEKEFFAVRDRQIASAANKAARSRLITELPKANPKLYNEFRDALHYSESSSKFIRESGFYPHTGRGDINTYSIFAELSHRKTNKLGRTGILIPTGIATDDTNKCFFADLVETNRLVSLNDFENRKALFPGVHRSYKFCLLTLSGGPLPSNHESRFAFFLHDVLDLQDKIRVFTLTRDDFLRINPNTKTCPIFRTRIDADLTKKIYSYVPVLINEEKNQNPWGVSFMRMFDMSNDSHLFKTEPELREMGFTLKGNRFVKGSPPYQGDNGEMWLPLYEAKMIWHYDHRFGTYEGVNSRSSTHTPIPSFEQYRDPDYMIKPWYWVSGRSISDRLQIEQTFISGWRDITNSTNERTTICSLAPYNGAGDTFLLIFTCKPIVSIVELLSLLNSIVQDYFSRQKIPGVHLKYVTFKQLPTITQEAFVNMQEFMISTLIELIYTSYDIKNICDIIWRESKEIDKKNILHHWKLNKSETGGHVWKTPNWADAFPEIHWESPMSKSKWTEEELLAYDRGCPLPPFKWDEVRRARLKAELDAWFALLYGLNRDELRYILDPQDVYGKDFPGETFRVLKEKEIRKYGEYRTLRLVLEAYDRLAPDFDMEAHLKRLKEVWEKYQVDLSAKRKYNVIEDSKPLLKAAEQEPTYGQQRLFKDVPLAEFKEAEEKNNENIIREGCRVELRNCTSGKEIKLFVGSSSSTFKKTNDGFQVINCNAPLCQAMKGKKIGDRFSFLRNVWEVMDIRF